MRSGFKKPSSSIDISDLDKEIDDFINNNKRTGDMYNDEVRNIIYKMYGKVTNMKLAEFLNKKYNTNYYIPSSISCVYRRDLARGIVNQPTY